MEDTMTTVEEAAEFIRQFQKLSDDRKQLVIDKARELLAEQKAREADHG
jgi:hypothetical protein